jgi:hypothetical protein
MKLMTLNNSLDRGFCAICAFCLHFDLKIHLLAKFSEGVRGKTA